MLPNEALRDCFEVDESDIYRGTPPSPSMDRSRSLDSIASSSSSESFFGRGRLGAIAAVVELAISRWARGNSFGSSSSSSSSDTSSVTPSRSQRARLQRRRSSVGTLQTVQSERDFAARIHRIKAREESRQTPRKFALYLPPSLFVEQLGTEKGEHTKRIIWTASLPLVLGQLDAALKKAAKYRRGQLRTHIPRYFPKGMHTPHHDYMLPRDVTAQLAKNDGNTLPSGRKGKHRTVASSDTPITSTDKTTAKKAWFLDVASPTWEDMRAIGKVSI